VAFHFDGDRNFGVGGDLLCGQRLLSGLAFGAGDETLDFDRHGGVVCGHDSGHETQGILNGSQTAGIFPGEAELGFVLVHRGMLQFNLRKESQFCKFRRKKL